MVHSAFGSVPGAATADGAGHPSVLAAIDDMKTHLRDLPAASASRREAIYRDASICAQLMDCSYIVADTKHRAWARLDRLVTAVMIASRSEEGPQ